MTAEKENNSLEDCLRAARLRPIEDSSISKLIERVIEYSGYSRSISSHTITEARKILARQGWAATYSQRRRVWRFAPDNKWI